MPLLIVTSVAACYYCIPALMVRRGLRLRPPPQLEAALRKCDELVCEKLPPNLRCSTQSERSRLTILCALALLLWNARNHLHRLLLPSAFMLTGGGLVHFMVVKPLEAQLKQVIAEHNDSQTSKANAASENDQLRQTEALLGGENARLLEEVQRLQALSDEYKGQYERHAELTARLQREQREGVPPSSPAHE